MIEGQLFFLDTVLGFVFLLWVTEKGAAIFIVTTLVNNGVNSILGVIGEVVDLTSVVMKVKNLRLQGFCK